MPLVSDGPAPYAPPKAVMAMVHAVRNRDLPTPYTVDVLTRAGVKDTLAPRTLQALKLLDLVDERGEPTPALLELAKTPDNEFRERLAAVLRSAYSEVFQFVDPSEDTPEKIRGAFRVFKPRGQQERMVTLFLGLCEEAGIVAHQKSREAPPPRQRDPATRPKRRPTKETGASKPKPQPSELPTDFRPSPATAAGHHAFIRGLIQSLPEVGSVWPTEKREKWAKAALATFDLIYELPPSDGKRGEGP